MLYEVITVGQVLQRKINRRTFRLAYRRRLLCGDLCVFLSRLFRKIGIVPERRVDDHLLRGKLDLRRLV